MHFIYFQNQKWSQFFLDKIGLNSENFKFERQPPDLKCSPPEFKMITRALYLGRLTMSRSGPLVNWDPLNYQLLAAFVVNKYFYGAV